MQPRDYRLGYRADLEGLRAVSIVLVVAAHAGVPWLAGGFVGVDVFFVLSGYLITGLLLRELAERGSIRFGEFYVRRLRRLLPGLLVMVAVVCVLARVLLAPGDQHEQSVAAASAVFWVSNFHFALAQLDYFSGGADGNLFLHTWSLGVEEQFYLLWPALLAWLWGRHAREWATGPRRLKIGLAVVFVASLAACIGLTWAQPRLAFYLMPVRAWQFSAGAMVWLYVSLPGGSVRETRWSGSAGWLGLIAVLSAALWLTPHVAYPGGWAMVPTIGAVAIIASGTTGTGVSQVLAWRPLQALGRVSYAWYLWHWPILLLARALSESDSPAIRTGAVIVSLGLATISYRCVEAPLRHRQGWLTRPAMTMTGCLAVMALASLLCLRWYNHASDLEHSPQYRRLAAAHADAPTIYGMDCDQWYSSDELRVCGFGSRNASHTAVLLGDSVAGQWFPAVARAFARPDWQLLVITKSACPMVDEPIFYERIGRTYTECSTWRNRALQYLARLKPQAVIMGSVATYAYSSRQWIEGTRRILALLSPVSGHVYVLRSTPHLPFNGPDCLAAHTGRPRWLAALSTCSADVDDHTNSAVLSWLKQASKPYANVSIIDLNGAVCPEGVCKAERNGLVVFRDAQHMTASFASSLSGPFAAQLQQPGIATN